MSKARLVAIAPVLLLAAYLASALLQPAWAVAPISRAEAPAQPLPLHEDRWTELGPDAGVIDNIAVDPLNPAVVYASSWTGGVFKSSDFGQHWARLGVKNGLSGYRVTSIALSPSQAGAVYVTVMDEDLRGGLFVSLDGGNTFSKQDACQGWGAAKYAFDPLSERRRYLLCPNSLMISNDWGPRGPRSPSKGSVGLPLPCLGALGI